MASKTEELEFEIYQQIQSLDASKQTIIYKNIRSIKFNMIGYGQLLAGKDDAKFGKKKNSVLEAEIFKLISTLEVRRQNIIKDNLKKIKFNLTYYGRKSATEQPGIVYVR
jgi:hypothetical protein